MARRLKKEKSKAARPGQRNAAGVTLPPEYREACRLAVNGQYDTARGLLHTLALTARDKKLRALIVNDLAALDVMD